ncbi:uncharacterized protein EV154DRAFT_555808 [Mucor mucedo]|uniref:uncharacterized protein n=1 Tax=Mucor mucedo TaxID=29922 RepID=UPI00221E6730|nr:uncharacterized protein EV154DRAFT_555808 [Mucor mucedo]KAI7875833.1 hypothetical protein EV154DRAFT_555808 [Mucor mucedo]
MKNKRSTKNSRLKTKSHSDSNMGDSPPRKGKRKSPDQSVDIVPKKQKLREEATKGVISRALSYINSFGILSNRSTTDEKPTVAAIEPSGIGGRSNGDKTNGSSDSSANESSGSSANESSGSSASESSGSSASESSGSSDNESSVSSDNESGSSSSSSVIDLSSDDEDLEKEVTDSDSNILFQHGRICFYSSDLISLRPRRWLNDNVIDVALSLAKKTNDVHVFDSQFFAKLRTISESDGIPKDFYAATSGWFRNEQLRDRKFWLIPVCDKNHWYLIVVTRHTSRTPVVMVLDSLQRKAYRSYKSVDIVKAFLRQKYKAEHNRKLQRVLVKILDVPQQTNNHDCGLHLLRSAELFMNPAASLYTTFASSKKPFSAEDNIFKTIKVSTRNELSRSILPLIARGRV